MADLRRRSSTTPPSAAREHARRGLRLRRPRRASSCTSSSSPDGDPRCGPAAAYLHVPDADALAAEWAHVPGTETPVDTDYGLREGRHVDPDGNLLRFGSPLASARVTREIRWGVVGPGRIAEKVVEDFAVVDGAACGRGRLAVARPGAGLRRPARHRAGARLLRRDPGRPGRRRPLRRDPAPAAPRHRAGRAAGRQGAAGREGVHRHGGRRRARSSTLARETGVFVMEAMWTRFQPAVVALRDLIADGAIGEVRSVQADLGVRAGVRPHRPAVRPRARRRRAARPRRLRRLVRADAARDAGARGRRRLAVPRPAPTPRPRCCSTTPTGGRRRSRRRCATRCPARPGSSGRRAGSTSSPASTTRRRSCCTGPAPSPRRSPGRRSAAGYAHELIEVTECLRAGRTESAVMPLADTLAVQTVLGGGRRAARRPARRGPRRPLTGVAAGGGFGGPGDARRPGPPSAPGSASPRPGGRRRRRPRRRRPRRSRGRC